MFVCYEINNEAGELGKHVKSIYTELNGLVA